MPENFLKLKHFCLWTWNLVGIHEITNDVTSEWDTKKPFLLQIILPLKAGRNQSERAIVDTNKMYLLVAEDKST